MGRCRIMLGYNQDFLRVNAPERRFGTYLQLQLFKNMQKKKKKKPIRKSYVSKLRNFQR